LQPYFDIYVLSTAPWNNPTALNDKLELERSKLESENKTAKEIIEKAAMNSASNTEIVFN